MYEKKNVFKKKYLQKNLRHSSSVFTQHSEYQLNRDTFIVFS